MPDAAGRCRVSFTIPEELEARFAEFKRCGDFTHIMEPVFEDIVTLLELHGREVLPLLAAKLLGVGYCKLNLEEHMNETARPNSIPD